MIDMSTLAESAELSKLKQQEEDEMSDSEFDLKEMTDDSDFNRLFLLFNIVIVIIIFSIVCFVFMYKSVSIPVIMLGF